MKIGDFTALEPEVMRAMFDMAKPYKAGDVHIELGAGNGQFVEEGVSRGLNSIGYEIEEDLALDCQSRGLNVVHGDFFDYDLSGADIITLWFTDEDGLNALVAKLYAELKTKGKVVAVFSSLRQSRGGVLLPEVTGVPVHPNFAPVKNESVLSNRIWLFKR